MAARPHDPQARIDYAFTLVDAGATAQAVREVQRAVEQAPAFAHVYDAQGWVLTHNAIGVQYGKGFDYEAAAAAFRKAIALDPKDLDIRDRYAELLSYNHSGVRYAADSKLDEAIEVRRYVLAHRGAAASEDEMNDFLIELFYAGRNAELLTAMQGLPSSPKRDGVRLSALAAMRGTPAAIEAANGISDETKRKDALILAAVGLWEMRLYPQAADMLTASLPDPTGSNRLTGQILIFKNLQPYRGVDLPPTDPRYPLQLLIVSAITGTLSESVLDRCVSHSGFSNDEDWKKSLASANFLEGKLQTLARQADLPRVVVNDIMLNQMKLTTQPAHGGGVTVSMQIAGVPSVSFYVLPEGGAYKIVAGEDLNSTGTAALYLLDHKKVEAAIALLDWQRERTKNDQDRDDPLSGSLFARLWQRETKHDASAARLAAMSLLTDKDALRPLLAEVVALQSSAATVSPDDLSLLLATLYLRTEDAAGATAVSQRLLTKYPGSLTAVLLTTQSKELSKDWSALAALLDRQLEKHPGERLLLLASVREAELQGDFSRAFAESGRLLDSGHAQPVDQNNFAWLSLFVDRANVRAFEAMNQVTLTTQNRNHAFLNTLACLYAARGETALARQFLLDSMTALGVEEPDSASWYGFGRIYEQYGLNEAALDAYRRVDPPDHADPASAFVLAQRRIHFLADTVSL